MDIGIEVWAEHSAGTQNLSVFGVCRGRRDADTDEAGLEKGLLRLAGELRPIVMMMRFTFIGVFEG